MEREVPFFSRENARVDDMKINLNATATVMLKFLSKKSNQTESEMVEELVMDEYRRSGGGAK